MNKVYCYCSVHLQCTESFYHTGVRLKAPHIKHRNNTQPRINTQGRISARQTITQTPQQRPETPVLTLNWHASKYKVHKLHQRYIL